MPAATKNAPRVSDRFVVTRLRGTERAARALHQERLDEDVDVAVEHAVDVADLLLGPVIFDQLIWVQDVAADLAAEGNLLLGAADLLELRLLLLRLQIVEAGLQHLHCRVAVAVLRPLVLARDDDAARHVRDADRRIGHIDVLAAGAARTIRVDADVLVVDLDVDVFGQLGPHVERGERGVTPRGLIEWRDPHQAVDAGLGRYQTI